MSTIIKYPRIPVKLPDWKESLRRCADAVNYILKFLTVIEKSIIEESIIAETTSVGPLATATAIAPYSLSKELDDDALITENKTTGIITIGRDGWHTIYGHFECTGSNNNAYYGTYLVIAGTNFYLGAIQWDNNNPIMVFNGGVKVNLSAGDTIQAFTYCSAGTLTFTKAILSAEKEV